MGPGVTVYADGPPPGHTGGFGEPTCHQCHFDGPLDDPAGVLEVEGIPATWEAGRRYSLRVRLARPGLARGGFQLAARFARGAAEGEQAGSLRPAHRRTAVTEVDATGVQYASHRMKGAEPVARDTAAWRLEWRAPAEGAGASAPVVFHVAANAANGDDSEFGDFIYVGCVVSDGPAARRDETTDDIGGGQCPATGSRTR